MSSDAQVPEDQSPSDFSDWFYCLAVVSFHITKGHVIESLHPKNLLQLTDEELKMIAHFSLPDTTIDSEGDVLYSFRYRKTLQDDFSYGSVFFRQTKDASAARGYMQKSVVAVTRRPQYLYIISDFVRVMAPLFFTYGSEVLEASCSEVRDWPDPSDAEQVLKVAGSEIHVRPQPGLELFQDVQLFSTFGSLSVALWLLWELALTGQQILVLGPTPDRCSNAVLGICSLIAPIPLAVDYRSFFTMFDKDFATISRPQNKQPVIIGGTNPFLLRSLEHFPNVVSLGSHRSGVNDSAQIARRNQTLRVLLRNRRWEKSVVLTREEPLVGRDEKLISSLRALGTDPKTTIAENNSKLRHAFRDLTKRFLGPLESYIRLRPFRSQAAKGGVRVTAYNDDILREEQFFSKEEFLTYITGNASRRDKQFSVELYRRFLAGVNFPLWLEAECRKLYDQRSEILRTIIVHTEVDELLALTQDDTHDLADKISRVLDAEMAKADRDIELCNRISEHLKAMGHESKQITS